ncbi:phosphoadenosine phosphosulfate reductase family protein [Infirmifilum lucidum]|uniref:Phosphoadenosine phosphosulfate reductase family protein n=1 Tax=Infirmifilum lucidum TaxID=2776706 RepID=A0A7L9FL46_9CREN|nr:phosphoadenosine phosphosulfate reductase family protein [Infirmifilum lucidum]QOJ79674.1 phosphoadenosine phosphosulfate reductase family protein [Infirmifilum lucidum]
MESASILKKVSARVYWDLRLNAPLAYSRDGLTARLRLTPPGDAYPAVGRLYRLVWDTIDSYFTKAGSRAEEVIPRRKAMLANKVMYPDFAVELVTDAQVVGHFIYDIRGRAWRFRPLYGTVLRMVESEVGFYAKTRLDKLARGYVVKQSHLEKFVLPREDEYVAVASRNMSYLGVGVVLRNGRIYVLKSWLRKPYSLLEGDPSWWDIVRLHDRYLSEKEREATSFIREVYEKYKLPVVVSFSGGKDSLVTLYLALKALGPERVKVLFNNTGLEFPETVEYVYRVCERMGVELIVADAGDAFWRGVSVMGPPARDLRWCCKVTKFAPIARVLRRLFPGGALSLVGQRRYESAQRALSPRVWRNAWLPNVVAATPIQDWSALDVWLYIFRERLLPNPLYYLGLDRLGCWLCPATEMGEFELAKAVHGSLYSKWSEYLFEYARENSVSESWVRYGLWRWVRPPKDILNTIDLKEQDVLNPVRGARVTWHYEGNKLVFELEKTMMKPESTRLRNILLTSKKADAHIEGIRVEEGQLVLETRGVSPEVEKEVVRAVIRAFYCVGCLECANWCPTGAISLGSEGGIVIDEGRCIRCGTCQQKCPIAEYTLKFQGFFTSG